MALYTEPRWGGMVTVDYKARGFRLGLCRRGPLHSTKKYTGRGWRRQLEEDATAYLYAAVNTPAGDEPGELEARHRGEP